MLRRRNVTYTKCYLYQMLNVIYAKCYLDQMLTIPNVNYTKCYLCKMLPIRKCTVGNVTDPCTDIL